MSLLSWRHFPFFEGTPIKDPHFGSEQHALYSDASLSAICAAGRYIAIATRQTTVQLIDQNIEKAFSFPCYHEGWTITKLAYCQYEESPFLVTIAERQGYPLYLKIWNLNKVMNMKSDKFDLDSSYLTQCSVNNEKNNYPMTCFAHINDLSILAFGFSNGSVIIVRGDLIHDRGSRQRIIYQDKEPITSVTFKSNDLLYASTFSKIFTLSTSGRNDRKIERLLDDNEGADLDCTCLYGSSLLVSRESCFQFYDTKGKTRSIQLSIPKKKTHLYHDRYLVCISETSTTDFSESSISSNKLLILDLKNNFVVFNQLITSAVSDIFEIWEDLYVLVMDGSLLRLHEKNIKENIEILVKSNLFPLALKLINENRKAFTDNEVMNIEKLYGFYLYNRNDFGAAIDQFIACIPLGKTSEIISMFKGSSKIQYLIRYILKMVELKISTPNHIDLLLTSYCKLKMLPEFERFIRDIETDDDYDIIPTETHKSFDIDSIIQLCKDNEYYSLALVIAEKFQLASKVVSIQIHDLKDPFSALDYINSLPIDDLLRVLVDNVSTLLNMLPNETTQLLIDVFTGKYTIKSRTSERGKETDNSSTFSYPIFTSYKQFSKFMNTGQGDDEIEEEKIPTYQPPRPRMVFSSFMNHNYQFVIFLEACVESYEKYDGNSQDKSDIINTLYELYLTLAQSDKANKQDWEEKAKFLLYQRKEWSEEEKSKLILISNIYEFSEGEMIIREQTESISDLNIEGYELDLFRSSIFASDIEKSYDIVLKYGHKEKELYRLALLTYTSSNAYYEKIGDKRLQNLLGIIEQENCLTLLEVLDCLTNEDTNVRLGVVKNYLLRNIEKQKLEIQKNEELKNAYESRLSNLKSNIADLMNDPKILNSTKCSVCNNPLEFPMVCYKCGHQIHEHCLIESTSGKSSLKGMSSNFVLGDTDEGFIPCPICVTDQDALILSKKQQEDFSLRQDLFKSTVRASSDKFKSMFSFLGRGGMETSKLVYDGSSI